MVKVVCFVNTKFLRDMIKLRSKCEDDPDWEDIMKENIREKREYDGVISALYKKHWREGSVNPWMQFGFMMSMSIGEYHMSQLGEKKPKKMPALVPSDIPTEARPIMPRYGSGGTVVQASAHASVPSVQAQVQSSVQAAVQAETHQIQAQLQEILQQQRQQQRFQQSLLEQNDILKQMSQGLFTEFQQTKQRQEETEKRINSIQQQAEEDIDEEPLSTTDAIERPKPTEPTTTERTTTERTTTSIQTSIPKYRQLQWKPKSGKKAAVVSVCLDESGIVNTST